MAERQGKGDGGLFQRHDHPSCPPSIDGERADHRCRGRWVAQVDLGWQGGKRRRKTLYGATRKEAQIKRATALRQRDRGTLVIAAPTVEAWMTYWLDTICAERGLKINTLKGYRSYVGHHIIPQLGRHRLDRLAPEHLRTLYRDMRAAGLSEASLRQTHAILHRALKVAEREGKVGRNVADLIDPPATIKNKRTALTVEQARQVLAVGPLRAWVALYLGVRQGEALALRWSDVDLDRGWMSISRSLVREPGRGLVYDTPKSRAGVRSFPIPPKALAQFKLAHIIHEQAGGEPDGLIFHHHGKPIDHRADWQAWTDLLVTAGVPHVALHAARNTTASLHEAARTPVRIVAQMLGQSTIEVTHGYQNAEDDVLVAAMLALEAYVEPDAHSGPHTT